MLARATLNDFAPGFPVPLIVFRVQFHQAIIEGRIRGASAIGVDHPVREGLRSLEIIATPEQLIASKEQDLRRQHQLLEHPSPG
jgi:hypothetical protein